MIGQEGANINGREKSRYVNCNGTTSSDPILELKDYETTPQILGEVPLLWTCFLHRMVCDDSFAVSYCCRRDVSGALARSSIST